MPPISVEEQAFVPSTSLDTPRPSKNTIRRRVSSQSGSKKRSPLRYSQSESSFAHFFKPRGTVENDKSAVHNKLATVSASTAASIRQSQDNSNSITVSRLHSDSSSSLSRKSSEGARPPLFLLEQVFYKPGGGIETRQCLGVYTSKRKAEKAAQMALQEYSESSDSADSSGSQMKLITSQVDIDKKPKLLKSSSSDSSSADQ